MKDGSCEYEEKLQFDIKVGDIPRMARICFAVYEVCKSVKSLRAKRLRDANNHVCWLQWCDHTPKNKTLSPQQNYKYKFPEISFPKH